MSITNRTVRVNPDIPCGLLGHHGLFLAEPGGSKGHCVQMVVTDLKAQNHRSCVRAECRAFYGEEAIPASWKQKLATRALIESLAERIFHLSWKSGTRRPGAAD